MPRAIYYEFGLENISISANVQFSIYREDRFRNKIDGPLYDNITINFTQDDA